MQSRAHQAWLQQTHQTWTSWSRSCVWTTWLCLALDLLPQSNSVLCSSHTEILFLFHVTGINKTVRGRVWCINPSDIFTHPLCSLHCSGTQPPPPFPHANPKTFSLPHLLYPIHVRSVAASASLSKKSLHAWCVAEDRFTDPASSWREAQCPRKDEGDSLTE